MSDLSLNVVMIGPKGCGKTSMLSFLVTQFESFITNLKKNDENVKKYCAPSVRVETPQGNKNLTLVCNTLQSVDKINELKGKGVPVLLGTGDHQIYVMNLSVAGVDIDVNFHDFPGVYFIPEFHKRMDPAQLQNCENIVKNADVIMLCVDVPSQITYPDTTRERWQEESYIKNIQKIIMDSLENISPAGIKKTVVVASIKCEAEILNTTPDDFAGYVQSIDPHKNKGLYGEIKNLYQDLFKYLEEKQTEYVDSFYVPVITMGCVKASGVRYDHEKDITNISFQPVFRGDLHHYQCNCLKALGLSLWSAAALIDKAYSDKANLYAKIKAVIKGRYPTRYFYDALIKQCSLLEMYVQHIGYDNLTNEDKKYVDEMLRDADTSYHGCRLITKEM